MATSMQHLGLAPETQAFVPLAEHQSRTPASFYDGPPVLHYHNTDCNIVIDKTQLEDTPLQRVLDHQSPTNDDIATNGGSADDLDDGDNNLVVLHGFEVWVATDQVYLFSRSASTGVTIPYPAIIVHATRRMSFPGRPDEQVQGLYMQVAGDEMDEEDADQETVTMTIVPSDTEMDEEKPEPENQLLFNAVTACSNLCPDPEGNDDDDDDDIGNGAPINFDGMITADNMHQLMDSNGNFVGFGGPSPAFPLPLGPGAGTVHAREDAEEEDTDEHVNGASNGEDDEVKWRRTD
ncbi:hypothetical protein N7532_007790 [Penicillium argentinense]|uniref:Regulator of volume decrease after cellular swelling-domain-containing protein n=1 Tax=Penicillium argentinense TaxID=1131581 RepID=A0A9W9EWD7_9EURO|nr:uncharacterized protein N7532_007790 [Penicillium argentinense]KAJ5089106.1 hypothetical protein N7532_007790 [Penicillium argentinense]